MIRDHGCVELIETNPFYYSHVTFGDRMNLWQANQSRRLDGIRFMFLPATLLFYARPFPAAATSRSPPHLASFAVQHLTAQQPAVQHLAVQQRGALVVLPTSCPNLRLAVLRF